jgi:hypothetical protein
VSMLRVVVAAWLLVVAGSSTPQATNVRAQTGQARSDVPLLIIVASATIGDDIKMGMLRSTFEGHATEFNGKRLIPFNQQSGSPARERFDRHVLGLTPGQVGKFWVDQRVRGGTQAPRALASADLTLRVIASLPSSIGYVTMSPRALPRGLKALAIDGKHATDRDYPFATR